MHQLINFHDKIRPRMMPSQLPCAFIVPLVTMPNWMVNRLLFYGKSSNTSLIFFILDCSFNLNYTKDSHGPIHTRKSNYPLS